MKRLIKLLSAALCLTILLSASLVGAVAFSLSDFGFVDKDTATADEAEVFKDETVYVMAKADGTVDKIIVSDWIKNNKGADTITDLSTVGDIENVKTDASFMLDDNNMRVWEAKGEDLHLQGTGTQPLPVDLTVTYSLDGSVISPEQLAGKSGKVTFRFDYTNNAYETVKIDGKDERVYVPFLMMSGMMLDSKKFSNVTVTNGKVISDGDRIMLAGIAFPGLQHDLGLNRDEIDIPSFFEVTADVKDFALGTTVTIAANALTKNIDPNQIDSLDDLKDSLTQLETAMTALIDGSSRLYTGLNTLLEKSGTLSSGVEELYAGAQQLSEVADQVDNGTKQLSEGASTLSDGTVTLDLGALDLSNGLSVLDSNSDALNNGSDLTFTSILATARDSLREAGLNVPDLTPENYTQVLNSLLEQLSDSKVKAQAEATAESQVTAAVEANREAVTAAVTEAVNQNVRAQVESSVRAEITAQIMEAIGGSVGTGAENETQGETGEEAAEAAPAAIPQEQINALVEEKMASAEVIATIDALIEQNMQSETVQGTITQNTDEKIQALIAEKLQSEEVQNGIADALSKAKAGRDSIGSLKTQLDSYSTFHSGLKTYTGGVGSASEGAQRLHGGTTQIRLGSAALKDGASALSDGTQQLSSGADALKNGVLTLKNGVPALIDGVSQLRDGSMKLSDGLKQFNEEGISKITSLLKDDFGGLAERIKAIIRVSQNYKSYSGLTDQMDGEVKFIYKTAEIE